MTSAVKDDEIIVYADEEEAEYQAVIERLADLPKPAEWQKVDFNRLGGRSRVAKAIVLYQVCEHLWSLRELALRLGITLECARRLLYEALAEGISDEQKDLLRELEIQKTFAIDKQALEQFKRSCEDAIEVETEWEVVDDEGNGIAVSEGTPGAVERVRKRKRKGQSGNPAYPKIMQANIQLRAKLTGLEAPRQVEIDKTDRQLRITEVVVATREDAEAARAAGLLK